MRYDMNGNIVEHEYIETDRKFYAVPVAINSVVWEIEYTGHMDQEYRYDELGDEDPELLDNGTLEIQFILQGEIDRAKRLAEQEKKNEHD